jgi:hypothetical protein
MMGVLLHSAFLIFCLPFLPLITPFRPVLTIPWALHCISPFLMGNSLEARYSLVEGPFGHSLFHSFSLPLGSDGVHSAPVLLLGGDAHSRWAGISSFSMHYFTHILGGFLLHS